MLVTDGFLQIQYSPEISEAEDVELKNAQGDVCVTDPGCDSLKWINLQIQFCSVDPDAVSMVTGYPTVLDHAGTAVGNRVTEKVQCNGGFALEVWTEIPRKLCNDPTAQGQWGYFLAPCVGAGILGDFTVENDAISFTYNAKTRSGGSWAQGPYAVDHQDAAGAAGPLLTPMQDGEHLDLHLTTIAPPEPVCGCQPMPAAPTGP